MNEHTQLFAVERTNSLVAVQGSVLLEEALKKEGFTKLSLGYECRGVLARSTTVEDTVISSRKVRRSVIFPKGKRVEQFRGANGYQAFLGEGPFGGEPYQRGRIDIYHAPDASISSFMKLEKLDALPEQDSSLSLHLSTFSSEARHYGLIELICTLFDEQFGIKFAGVQRPQNTYQI